MRYSRTIAFVALAGMFLGINTVDCLLCHDGAGHLDTVSLWGYQQKRQNIGHQESMLAGLGNFDTRPWPQKSKDHHSDHRGRDDQLYSRRRYYTDQQGTDSR